MRMCTLTSLFQLFSARAHLHFATARSDHLPCASCLGDHLPALWASLDDRTFPRTPAHFKNWLSEDSGRKREADIKKVMPVGGFTWKK